MKPQPAIGDQCPGCHRPIGTLRTVERRVDAAGDWDEEVGPLEPDIHEVVTIGARYELVGYVIAGRRHPEADLTWYRPKADGGTVRPRPPFVLTCRCGIDVLVTPYPVTNYANASNERAVELIADDLMEAAHERDVDLSSGR